MSSLMRRRSLRALTRGGIRAWLIVSTLAASIVGVWLLAIPANVDATMAERLATDRFYDVRLHPNAVALDPDDLTRLEAVANVVAVDAKVVADGAVLLPDGRLVSAGLVGVRDWSDQTVDIVGVTSGTAPSGDEMLLDSEDLRHQRLRADTGSTLVVYGPDSSSRRLTVTGTGGSLLWASGVREGDPIVYLPSDTLLDMLGWPGYTSIEVLLGDHDPESVARTIADLEEQIEAISPGMTYWRQPVIREPGDWPDKEAFDNFRSLFSILATVAVVSGLFVVYNTVTTMVRREAPQIGVLKAVGARRRHIASAYLGTAGLFGLVATLIGSILGVLLTNALVGTIAGSLMAAVPGFRIPLTVFGIALLVGVVGTMLAALPATLWAIRVPVRATLESHGLQAALGRNWLDRILAKVGFLSRSSQLGLRSAARVPRRSAATGLQIGIAVGVAFGFISLGATMLTLVDRSFDAEAGDIHVYDQGGRPLDSAAEETIANIEGVAALHRIHYAALDFGGGTYGAWALGSDSTYKYDLAAGRWLAEGDTNVVVVGQALATEQNLGVGDIVTVERFDSAAIDVEVIGIDRVMVDDGKAFFVPLDPWLEVAGRSSSNAYWIDTTSPDADVVDPTAGAIEQALRDGGYSTRTELRYVERQATRSEATLILTFIVLLGVPVVAIGMISLVNTLTINTLERTKELGVLRSIGARKRHLARMLRAEGIAIAALGWMLGVPIGYGIARLLIWTIGRAFEATFPVVFPLWSLLPVLALTLLVAASVIRFPLRRVARMSAGEALRYE
jgi:putative ABC transport system permease protein